VPTGAIRDGIVIVLMLLLLNNPGDGIPLLNFVLVHGSDDTEKSTVFW
jgi:hypothetical protein